MLNKIKKIFFLIPLVHFIQLVAAGEINLTTKPLTTPPPMKKVVHTFADGQVLTGTGGLDYKWNRMWTRGAGKNLENIIRKKIDAMIKMHNLMILQKELELNNKPASKKYADKITKLQKDIDSLNKAESDLRSSILESRPNQANSPSMPMTGYAPLNTIQGSPYDNVTTIKTLSDGTILRGSGAMDLRLTQWTLGKADLSNWQNILTNKQAKLINEAISAKDKKKTILQYKIDLIGEEIKALASSIRSAYNSQQPSTTTASK